MIFILFDFLIRSVFELKWNLIIEPKWNFI